MYILQTAFPWLLYQRQLMSPVIKLPGTIKVCTTRFSRHSSSLQRNLQKKSSVKRVHECKSMHFGFRPNGRLAPIWNYRMSAKSDFIFLPSCIAYWAEIFAVLAYTAAVSRYGIHWWYYCVSSRFSLYSILRVDNPVIIISVLSTNFHFHSFKNYAPF